jgi:ribosome-interacting GTPase 1
MATRKRTSASQPTSTEDTSGVFMSQYDKIVEEHIAAIKEEIAEIKSALAELQSAEPKTGGADSRVDVLYSWYENVKRRV